MRRHWMFALLALLAAAIAIAAVACDDDNGNGDAPTATSAPDGEPTEAPDGDGDAAATDVTVQLLEFQVVPDPESAAAGSVIFNADNVGGANHELVVVRTDLAPDALPTADDGSVDEGGEGIEIVDEIAEFGPGTQQALMADLEAGSYVLLCNVVDATGAHYELGMTVGFEVTE